MATRHEEGPGGPAGDGREREADQADRDGGRQDGDGLYWRAAVSRPPPPRGEAPTRHAHDWEDDWGDRRGEDWGVHDAGTHQFEHARGGFSEFGVPSPEQGREIRERYSELDFAGRDDRYAGRSGAAYAPGELGGSAMGGSPGSYGARTMHPADRNSGSGERRPRGGAPARGTPPGREPPRIREGGRGRIREREEPTARDIMTAGPKSVRPDSTLGDVARIMRDENCGVVPVVDADGRLVGLITDRDMVMRTFTEERPWTAIRAGDVMTADVEAVHPGESVQSIIHLMGTRQIRRVPVVDRGDRLVGMVSMADVANRANEDEELQEALERISRRRSFWSRLWT